MTDPPCRAHGERQQKQPLQPQHRMKNIQTTMSSYMPPLPSYTVRCLFNISVIPHCWYNWGSYLWHNAFCVQINIQKRLLQAVKTVMSYPSAICKHSNPTGDDLIKGSLLINSYYKHGDTGSTDGNSGVRVAVGLRPRNCFQTIGGLHLQLSGRFQVWIYTMYLVAVENEVYWFR